MSETYAIVRLSTSEVVGDKIFDNARDAKLSLRHNHWNVDKFGVSAVKSVVSGPISNYNTETKKWGNLK